MTVMYDVFNKRLYYWIRAKVSFAILRSALLCLRGSRTRRRRINDIQDRDLEVENGLAGLSKFFLLSISFLSGCFSILLFTMTIVLITMSCRHFFYL